VGEIVTSYGVNGSITAMLEHHITHYRDQKWLDKHCHMEVKYNGTRRVKQAITAEKGRSSALSRSILGGGFH